MLVLMPNNNSIRHCILGKCSITACYILLLLIHFTSCTGHEPEVQSKPIQSLLPASNLPFADQSFIASKDTISTHGPGSITRDVLQDKKGSIWLATWEGIIRYDGKHFTNITLKEGLRQFHVFSILEDSARNLWFGTTGGGVYRYDGTSFRNFTTQDGLAGNAVMCMLEDRFGNIWFGTTDGACRYDGVAFTRFTTQEGLGSNFISSMVQDKTGKLWFGTDGGVNCCDPSVSPGSDGKSFTSFTNEKGVPFYRVRSILEDNTGNIWIGSGDELCRYDPSASFSTGLKTMTTYKTIVSSYIFEDKKGAYLVEWRQD